MKGDKLGEAIVTKYGVTQGRKSSSHLFSFYVTDMASALDNVNINDYMDPYIIAQLADDTTIIAETFESLRSKMKAIVSYSEKRYQIQNVKKTHYCHFSDNFINHPMFLDDNNMIYSIDCNKGHKYLGMLFYPTNDPGYDNFEQYIKKEG